MRLHAEIRGAHRARNADLGAMAAACRSTQQSSVSQSTCQLERNPARDIRAVLPSQRTGLLEIASARRPAMRRRVRRAGFFPKGIGYTGLYRIWYSDMHVTTYAYAYTQLTTVPTYDGTRWCTSYGVGLMATLVGGAASVASPAIVPPPAAHAHGGSGLGTVVCGTGSLAKSLAEPHVSPPSVKIAVAVVVAAVLPSNEQSSTRSSVNALCITIAP